LWGRFPFDFDEECLRVSFTQASRRLQGGGLGPDDVLRAMHSGRLAAQRISASFAFKAVRVCSADVKAYRAELRSAQLVSFEQAQRLLHCKSGARRYLEAAGHLTPRLIVRRDRGTWRWYAREDIDGFKDRYVSAKQAANIVGCSVERMWYWARHGRLSPVGGPHIDKWSRYWFDREQLVAWRRKFLRAREAQELLQVSSATMFRWVQQGLIMRREGPFGGRRSWYDREQVEAVPHKRKLSWRVHSSRKSNRDTLVRRAPGLASASFPVDDMPHCANLHDATANLHDATANFADVQQTNKSTDR
jgi:hypothetical protein